MFFASFTVTVGSPTQLEQEREGNSVDGSLQPHCWMPLNLTYWSFNAEKPKENKNLMRQITGNFSYNGQVLMHFASIVFDSQISCYRHLLQSLCTLRYCVRPKRSLNAMQMQILVFLWLCKKIYMHLILYKNKRIENYR